MIGFPIAIWQIIKIRRASEITKKATLKTQNAIFRNLLLSDVSTCTRNLEEIKLLVRKENYESAQSRISDVISPLIQIQEVLKTANPSYQTNFEQILLRLSIIRNDFEKKLVSDSVNINKIQINSQLAIISDSLNRLIGEAKISIEVSD